MVFMKKIENILFLYNLMTKNRFFTQLLSIFIVYILLLRYVIVLYLILDYEVKIYCL